MKLAVSLNNEQATIAEVNAHGYLGVHLNLRQSFNAEEKGSLKISGYDLTDQQSTRFLDWKGFDINHGDIVSIEISPSGEAVKPTTVQHSAENKAYQDLTEDQAVNLVKQFQEQISTLQTTLTESKELLSEEDFKQLSLGIGYTMTIYDSKLLSPLYRAFPRLQPKELKDFSL